MRSVMLTSNPVYHIWDSAKQRVINPNTKFWSRYGGRGLVMCAHWLNDPAQFIADMGPRPRGTSIDRRNNDLGYLCPLCCAPDGNCRWATAKEQAANTRTVETFVSLLTTGPQSATVSAQVEKTSDQISLARSVPSHNWRAHWLTTAEFARVMGRRPQTVYSWLRDGTLAEFGIPVCQFRGSRLHSGRTFILNIY